MEKKKKKIKKGKSFADSDIPQSLVNITEGDDPWLREQARRRQLIKDACDKYQTKMTEIASGKKRLYQKNEDDHKKDKSRPLDPVARQSIVDDKHRVIYTPIAKVACSSWKWLLIALNGGYDISHPEVLGSKVHAYSVQLKNGLRSISSYSEEEQIYRFKYYTKVLAVRHPIGRLVSAHRDKFTWYVHDKGGYRCTYCAGKGSKIISELHGISEKELIMKNTRINVTLDDFLTVLTDPQKPSYSNIHWREQFIAAKPCHMHYDFIANVETMNEDSEQILKRAFNTDVTFPKKHVVLNGTTSATTDHFLKGVNITKEIRDKLLQRFSYDMALFGYS